MNYELELLSALISAQDQDRVYNDIIDATGNQPVFLVYGREFKFLTDYKTKYKKFPSKDVFEKKCDVELPATTESVQFYVDEVREAFLFSEMSRIYEAMGKELQNGKIAKAYSDTVKELSQLQSVRKLHTDVNLTDTFLERINKYDARRGEKPINGVPTGWAFLDIETSGWQQSEVVYIVGRAKSYKSWALLSWAVYCWEQGYVPLVFSKEMGAFHISRRVDAILGSLRFKSLKTGQIQDPEFDAFKKNLTTKFSGKHPFYVIETSGVGTYDIDYIAAKVQAYRPDVVFIDGVYLMRGKGQSEWEKQTDISRGIKQLALSEGVPIVGTLQGNRDSAGKTKKIQAHQVAYSDAYLQDADVLIAVNRLYDSINDSYKNEILAELIAGREAENVKGVISVNLDDMEFIESANQVYDDELGEEVSLDSEEEAVFI